MNLLLLSAGTRNKIVQYFREEMKGKGKVIAADCSKMAPAIYEADAFYLVPRIDHPDYIKKILAICEKEHITGVFSLIDPELSLLAMHREEFWRVGTTVVGSDYERCELSLDKYKMYCWLKEHGYRTALSFQSEEEFFEAVEQGKTDYPVFIKPVRGSASLQSTRADGKEEVQFFFHNQENLMAQEYLKGQEIGVDVYVDLITHKMVSVFAKKKLRMRAGETDKAVSFRDPKLFALVEKFVEEAGFIGQIDIDVFEENGEYVISEVNPRFGGGYPHAHACGVNMVKLMVRNLEGKSNLPSVGEYEDNVYMMKYSDVLIRKIEEK